MTRHKKGPLVWPTGAGYNVTLGAITKEQADACLAWLEQMGCAVRSVITNQPIIVDVRERTVTLSHILDVTEPTPPQTLFASDTYAAGEYPRRLVCVRVREVVDPPAEWERMPALSDADVQSLLQSAWHA